MATVVFTTDQLSKTKYTAITTGIDTDFYISVSGGDVELQWDLANLNTKPKGHRLREDQWLPRNQVEGIVSAIIISGDPVITVTENA